MNARLRIVPAILGCLFAAAPAIAQAGAKLAVGPDAGGYLCPDGRELYVKSCYDNSPYANCGVILMHLPLQRGYQQERTQTRSELTPSVTACKVYPLEFRNDGTVELVLPKSTPPQQTAKAPAAAPTPKPSTAAKSGTASNNITVVDGMAIGYDGVRSSLVRISSPVSSPQIFYVDEASRKPTGQKDTVAIWVLQVWPTGNPSAASVSAVWTELNANCEQNSYELTLGILLDRQANVLGAEAMNDRGTPTKDVTAQNPFNIACRIVTPSEGRRFASAAVAIGDASTSAAPKSVAQPATPAAKPAAARPAMAPIRLPETETEKKFFQSIKDNLLQTAVSTILKSPDGKAVPVAELTDEQGMMALHWAAANRNAAAIRWLLDKKSEVNLADKKGRTPLKIALDNKDTRVMTMLLDRGADARLALPGHDDELTGFRKTSELVEFLIRTAARAENRIPACSWRRPGTDAG